MFEVYRVGGAFDGKLIAEFPSKYEAIAFSDRYWKEHEDEFDGGSTGLMILDANGNIIEW